MPDGSAGVGGAAGGMPDGGAGASGADASAGAGGGAGASGSAGTGPDYPATNACGTVGEVVVGQFARHCGTVNVHTTASGWAVDDDCTSGCNVGGLSYCTKFYPSTDRVVGVPVSSDPKPFTAGGGTAPACGGSFPGVGQSQFACCDNPCALGSAPVGMYGEWCGKVNVHTNSAGNWEVDADCSSGCEAGGGSVAYCQKFFPTATSVVQVAVSPEDKPYTSGGCSETFPGAGQEQYVCCAPGGGGT